MGAGVDGVPPGTSLSVAQEWLTQRQVKVHFLEEQRWLYGNVESVPDQSVIHFPCSDWNIFIAISVDATDHTVGRGFPSSLLPSWLTALGPLQATGKRIRYVGAARSVRFRAIASAREQAHSAGYLDIDRLRRASPTSVRLKLGRPTYQGRGLECGAPTCWAFEYGPRPQAESFSSRDLGNGLSEVTVVTGGPCLLLLGIDAGCIHTVQWRGQK